MDYDDRPVKIRFVLVGNATNEGSEAKWSFPSRLQDVLDPRSYEVWYTSIAVEQVVTVMQPTW